MTEISYQVGETVRLSAAVTDADDAAADPSTMKITIRLPSGTAAVTAQAMTNPAAGSYYYDYTTTIIGRHRYNVTGVGSSGRVTIVRDSFFVVAAI